MILNADAMYLPIASGTVQTVVTSPPYWGLRDYGVPGQLGLEKTPEEYVDKLVCMLREVRRVLREDGTLWLNLGDSYAGSGGPGSQYDNKAAGKYKNDFKKYDNPNRDTGNLKPKDLVGIPWRVAFALQADGWYLRSDIIWSKPNPMPESVTDRPTKSHEYLFLLSKSAQYYFDQDAVREDFSDERMGNPGKYRKTSPKERKANNDRQDLGFINNGGGWEKGEETGGRNIRSVWTIPTQPVRFAHFATFPEKLVEPCILAGTSEKGCCPKCGKAWVRVLEKETNWQLRKQAGSEYGKDGNYQRGKVTSRKSTIGDFHDLGTVKNLTVGWQPACDCWQYAKDLPIIDGVGFKEPLPPVPCIVLDPFSGSGTVERVAIKNRRQFVGTELKFEYIHKIARKRTNKVQVKLGL